MATRLLFFAPAWRRGICALLLAGVYATSAWAQDKDGGSALPEVKLSVAQSPAFPLGKAAERWAALVNETAARAFNVKLHPGVTLAGRDPAREFGALKDGLADMAVGSALAWSAQFPSAGVYALPWLAPDATQQEALAANAALLDLVAKRAAFADVIVLAVAPVGARVLATSSTAVRTPAEAAGLRIRVPGAPLAIDTYAALTARPQTLDFAAAQSAYASGALDGQDALPTTLVAQRITAIGQRTVTRWGAFADAMIFAVRRPVWNGWTEAQRKDVRAAAELAAREAQGVAREETALAELVKQGVTVVTLSAVQRAALRAAVQNVWVKWTPAIGPELVAAAEAAVASAVAVPAVSTPVASAPSAAPVAPSSAPRVAP
jgi:TRAP-type C4-dicarboxylate transport system substrate-binding protein